MYQLVSPSRYRPHRRRRRRPGRRRPSAAVTSRTSSAVLDSTYRSSTSAESVRRTPARSDAFAYSARKYQAFHSGSTACRTLSRMPGLGDDQVGAAQDRRGHQEPAHRVRTVPLEHLPDVRVVAPRLGHLLPVVAEHDAVRHAGHERRPVEQRGGQHVQRVEPAAGLAVVLDDEVARVVVLEPVPVLERVVHLGVRHRAGFEPAVQHLRHPAHGRPAGRVVRVGPGQLVDERPVQVVGPHPEVALQLVQRAVDVDPRVGRIVGGPHRDRRTPEPVPGDRPVPGALQPLAELAVLDVRGHPGDLLVQLDHPVPERGDRDEPGRHRPLDQRGVAAPAVRVRVLVGVPAQQQPGLLQVGHDRDVRVEHVVALVRRHLRR